MQNHKKNDFTNGDTDPIALILVVLICIGFYYFVIFPQMRGPTADMEINAAIEPNGVLSQYKVTLQFVDDLSYTQFLSFLNSQKFTSLMDYEFRTFSGTPSFSIINDSTAKTIRIEAKQPFDPNNATMNIRIKKDTDFWEYEDKSIINSSHLPEKYINKLTYTLTIPSELIYANTLENSSSLWSEGKQLTWHIDRNKNPLNPMGDSIASPTIYAKIKVPEQNTIPRIVIFIIVGIIIIIGGVIYINRR